MMVNIDNLHIVLSKMMARFHDFCERNGIEYYILGGTCLGAFRHKGFIPWDDDIDIGIPREEYNNLIDGKWELPFGLEIFSHSNKKGYPYSFAKLVDNSTTLIERYYPSNIMGVYIDIFPLDGVNRSVFLERIKQSEMFFWKAALRNHFYTKEKSSLIKKAFKEFSKLFNEAFLFRRIDRLCQKTSLSESSRIANYHGAWWTKEVMDKSIFGKPTLYDFENMKLYGPENIENYLEALYGDDYMTLPPQSERSYRHEFILIDLNRPYSEYSIGE